VQQAGLRLMIPEQFEAGDGKPKTVARRELELRPHAALQPKLGPVVAPAVRLRGGADEVVAQPAEPRSGSTVRPGEDAAELGKVFLAVQFEKFQQQVRVSAGATGGKRHGRRESRGPQGAQAVGFGGKGGGVLLAVYLEEAALAAEADREAVVNAAARGRRCALDAELSPK
jgi:hypothetical protein